MFLLRCAFFLSIVYAGILCGLGSMRSPQDLGAALTSEASLITGTGVGAVVARATEWCATRPVRCAHDAARLDALVQSTAEGPHTDDEAIADAEGQSAPLPIPDPRRRVVRSMLTGAR